MGPTGPKLETTNTFAHEPTRTLSLKCSSPDGEVRAESLTALARRSGSRHKAARTSTTESIILWLSAFARRGRSRATTSSSRRRQLHQDGPSPSTSGSIGSTRSATDRREATNRQPRSHDARARGFSFFPSDLLDLGWFLGFYV